jgi:hypothetical protein
VWVAPGGGGVHVRVGAGRQPGGPGLHGVCVCVFWGGDMV